jgi:hypothetical protein
VKTNPTTVIVSPLPQFQEQEPNDTIETATRVTLPCGINGRIGKARDLDHFVFQASKGKAIRFEVKARRFGTPLQSHRSVKSGRRSSITSRPTGRGPTSRCAATATRP